ncbi:hypothetical protein [Phenylobacterium zucineum]|uniref:hypothetical protein n=1 Tax=Phenylobacterium zucineum TaxID=284016 RepID=UPI0003038AEC|nr:hypothetical protein [Phenylobacterium zucineum]
MRIIFTAAAAAALMIGTPALAKDMHCNVNKDFAPMIDGKEVKSGGTTYKFKVKDTFKGVPDSVSTSDYNGFVNIKFGAERTTSKSVNVQVRPRKSSECLNGVYDDNKKQIWGGAYCDTSNHKKASSLTLRKSDSNPALYIAAGAATTTSKQNHLMGLYTLQGSEYVLSGACVENK